MRISFKLFKYLPLFTIVERISESTTRKKMSERYDCHYCKESLFGKKYVLREENPYCVKCYESLYSNTCEECKKPIGCNSRVTPTL